MWICKVICNNDHKYYEMLFVYIDDILALNHQPSWSCHYGNHTILYCKRRNPEIYSGANISCFQSPNGCKVWSTSPKTYVKNSIQVIGHLLTEDGHGHVLKSNVKNPFPTGYKPEIDITDKLSADMVSHFLQLIGILQWAVELGWINIYLKVLLLSQYRANPWLGHLEAAYRIFGYLKKHMGLGWLAFDPKALIINERIFHPNADWKEFYGKIMEELPSNMP